MSGTIRISLRAGERVYVNGAVIRVDRRTTLEFLNDVVFLLEQHVMQPEEATTPFRKLYFCVQKMLITPSAGYSARQEFYQHYLHLLARHENDARLIDTLETVRALVNTGRNFEALKRIRALCEEEDAARGVKRETVKETQGDGEKPARRRVRSRRRVASAARATQRAAS